MTLTYIKKVNYRLKVTCLLSYHGVVRPLIKIIIRQITLNLSPNDQLSVEILFFLEIFYPRVT